jgi:hypothetical protein
MGIESAGSDEGTTGGSSATRIEAASVPAYGTSMAAVPSSASQYRWRRVPSPLRPNVPDVPVEPWVPAYASDTPERTRSLECKMLNPLMGFVPDRPISPTS